MKVKHASNTVEPESIKVVLVHPESQVAQEESEHLMVAIVEQSAVPELVLSFGTRVEVLVVCAIKLVQAVQDVLGSVTVNNIEKNNESQAVSRVDQLLQVLRRAISAAGGEEVVDLVAEAGIVGVFHDGHELDGVVTQALDAWEHVLGEFLVGGNPELW